MGIAVLAQVVLVLVGRAGFWGLNTVLVLPDEIRSFV